MRILVGSVVLFIAIVAPSLAQNEGAVTEDGYPVQYYNLSTEIKLNCPLPNPTNQEIRWAKNGTEINALTELKERLSVEKDTIILSGRATEDDYGNYSCAIGTSNQTISLRSVPHLRVPNNVNVVEEQKLKIVCRVIGKPYPKLEWLYTNGTGGNATSVLEVFGERAKLSTSEQGVENGELTIEGMRRVDAGNYTCYARETNVEASAYVRVKDMYAALWPFLGICAEVLVLCAVILLYERRRTKPELDDSDTDNHDQKKS